MIVLENLTKTFGTRTVLSGVSLDVPDRQNTVIIGASGAGKSVTLKLIVGLLEPDGGRVLVDGETFWIWIATSWPRCEVASDTSFSSPPCSTP